MCSMRKYVIMKKTDVKTFTDLHAFSNLEYEKLTSRMLSLCVRLASACIVRRILSITSRYPVNMNILAPKIGVLHSDPRHRIIFKIGLMILIKFN
jgi:hypothetical protein